MSLMAQELHEISFILGQVQNQLRELSLDFSQDRAVQTQDRSDLRVKMNEFADKLTKVDDRIETVEEFCTSNAPILKQLNSIKSNAAMAVVIFGALSSGILYLGYKAFDNFGPQIKEVILKVLSK